MNVEEVFCPDCYQWKKRNDLVETQYSDKVLYCNECGEVLVRLKGYEAEESEGVMIKLKDLLKAMHFVNCLKKVKIAYGHEKFLYGYDDIRWLMDKQVRIIDFYHSVVLIRLKEEGIDDIQNDNPFN